MYEERIFILMTVSKFDTSVSYQIARNNTKMECRMRTSSGLPRVRAVCPIERLKINQDGHFNTKS